MNGNIDLGSFVEKVKRELMDARCEAGKEAFFELESVQLEVAFTLAVEGQGRAKLFVVELGSDVKAHQMHKVVLQFRPLAPDPESNAEDTGPLGPDELRSMITGEPLLPRKKAHYMNRPEAT